jgi:hypothetical protein
VMTNTTGRDLHLILAGPGTERRQPWNTAQD